MEDLLAGEYLVEWFLELNRTRDYVVIAGMGGGGSYPKPISWKERESWSNLNRIRPTHWELKTLAAMDDAWLTGKSNKSSGRQDQDVGNYCGGKDVEECRKVFGAQLERVCSTCPE